MNFLKLTARDDIESIIVEFLPCFPYLVKKIDNIYQYSKKVSVYANVYILADNNKKKGLSIFYANDNDTKTGYISLIGIKDKYRRKGLGTFILNSTHNIMKSSGMIYSKLEVDNDNIKAYKFYVYNGYSYLCTASETSIYMIKKL